MQANQQTVGAMSFGWIMLAATAVAAQVGCSSPLTTVALREFLRESTMTLAVDSDAEEASKPDVGPKDSAGKSIDERRDAGLADAEGDDSSVDTISVEQRIERSLERLARTSGFDPVARDVLADTLERAAPEDWPDIIDSFASSLEVSLPRPSPNASTTPSAGDASTHHATKPAGGLTIPVAASVPAVEPAAPEAAGDDEQRVAKEENEIDDRQPPESPEEPPENPEELVAKLRERLAEARRNAPLAVRRGCFASKVRGWGNIDAFDEPRFMPGQDVLVYVELDNLDGIETARGFSTRVAAMLRLVDATDVVVEKWSFPVVEDRADSPRTDYFVRYLVRIPNAATAGAHRLEATLTDAVSSKTVTTSLPLEVVAEHEVQAR